MKSSPWFAALLLLACASSQDGQGPASAVTLSFRSEVQKYLDRYNAEYQRLSTLAQEARWQSQTRIVAGDTALELRTRAAEEALAAFTGSIDNIQLAPAYLRRKEELTPLQVRQLDAILFKAGGNPQTVAELVKLRIAAEAEQARKLNGFQFRLDGQDVTEHDIDAALEHETDLGRRRAWWEASKEVGRELRPGLVALRRLRNDTVRALGYGDFLGYMASEYGMSTADLARRLEEINRELRPLYTELHTYMRHELARRFQQPVPDLIPAHWLPNRWGQDWAGLVDVEGFDLDGAVAKKTPQWVIEQAARFYTSLGFAELPASFWERSSLYPVAPDAGFKKNTRASAWHVDLDGDVRALMSLDASAAGYETAHHELGFVHYCLAYSTPNVPILLRTGANRAFPEAVGSLMGHAATQPRCARSAGLEIGDAVPNPMRVLLKEAATYVVFIPWCTGTMFRFEKALYDDGLSPDRWNRTWWELSARYQGIQPPAERGEQWCDAATMTHVDEDPASYYDHALSYVLLFQLHDHIARQVLHEDPHDANYFGRTEVGNFLRSIMKSGASADWRKLLRDKTGSDLTARAMVDYFEPLLDWLRTENAGRKATLPPL